MIGKMVSLGFDLATLPARLTFRSARAMVMTPAQFSQFMAELREASDEVAREIQAVLASVDAEMGYKAAHLTREEKQRAAELALDAAEQHLSMAAVNMLRALWLSVNSRQVLEQPDGTVIIEHEP